MHCSKADTVGFVVAMDVCWVWMVGGPKRNPEARRLARLTPIPTPNPSLMLCPIVGGLYCMTVEGGAGRERGLDPILAEALRDILLCGVQNV
jgi:hypothetical protein